MYEIETDPPVRRSSLKGVRRYVLSLERPEEFVVRRLRSGRRFSLIVRQVIQSCRICGRDELGFEVDDRWSTELLEGEDSAYCRGRRFLAKQRYVDSCSDPGCRKVALLARELSGSDVLTPAAIVAAEAQLKGIVKEREARRLAADEEAVRAADALAPRLYEDAVVAGVYDE